MLVVGLGGHRGAKDFHRHPPKQLSAIIEVLTGKVLSRLPILGGVAVIEDQNHNPFLIEGIPAERLVDREKELLPLARELVSRLPVEEIDLLIVDQIGKCFAGTGMDTGIIGRLRIQGVPEPIRPRIHRIVALSLAPGSKGNANGMGLADFVTEELVREVDWQATYANCLTSTFTQRAMMPIKMADARQALEAARNTLDRESHQLKIVRIKNTLDLSEFYISQACRGEVSSRGEYRITPYEGDLVQDDGGLWPF
jgi:hypothetical protein